MSIMMNQFAIMTTDRGHYIIDVTNNCPQELCSDMPSARRKLRMYQSGALGTVLPNGKRYALKGRSFTATVTMK